MARIKLRGKRAHEWSEPDQVIPEREMVLMLDASGDVCAFKFGNGFEPFSALTEWSFETMNSGGGVGPGTIIDGGTFN